MHITWSCYHDDVGYVNWYMLETVLGDEGGSDVDEKPSIEFKEVVAVSWLFHILYLTD